MSIHDHLFTKLAFSAFAIRRGRNRLCTGRDRRRRPNQGGAVQAGHGTVSWTAVNGDASAFTLEGVKLTCGRQVPNPSSSASSDSKALPRTMAAIAIETTSTEAFTKTEDGATVEISPFKLTGLKLPAPDRRTRWPTC